MPESDIGKLDIRLELPPGTDLATTEEKIIEIEEIITAHPEVKHILGKLGEIDIISRGSNTAKLVVEMVDNDQREMNSIELSKLLMLELAEVSNVKIKIAPS